MTTASDSMPPGAEQERFPRPLRVLHWAIAALVAVQFSLILIFKNLQALNFGAAVLKLHEQCGLLVLALILVRFALAFRYRAPRNKQSGLPAWQRSAARLAHTALLIVLAAQPILGLMTAWARGEQISFLGIVPLPAPFELSNQTEVMLHGYHARLAYLMLGLLVVHIGAVIYNRQVHRQSVIERMLPEPQSGRFANRIPLFTQLLLCFGGILTLTMGAGLYGAHKYSEFHNLRISFEDNVVTKLDALRDAQLAARDMIAAPSPETAAMIRDTLRDAIPAMREEGGLPDARKALTGFERIADGTGSPALIKEASTALDYAVMGLAMDVFQRRLEITQLAAEGHDMIVLMLAPTLMLGALIAFLLSRSILTALGHARRMVASAASGASEQEEKLEISGMGEFAVLLRDISAMEHTLIDRERRRHDAEALKNRQIVKALAGGLSALSEGRLSYRITEPLPHSIEQIRQDFNNTMASLAEAMQEITDSAHLIDANAETVRAAGENLAKRSERQASDLNATVEIFGNMSSSVTQSSEDATQSREVMGRVSEATQETSAAFDQTMAAMGEVETSSQAIVEIIALIDQIALQTNMLALNAGVEAARAGDAGKGFAIVAGEVRILANRSAEAADQIRHMLESTSENVATCSGLVERSGAAIKEMQANIASVDELVANIVRTVEKQAGEIRAMNGSIQLIDGTVQENAAMAEETNAALSGICLSTAGLKDLVARFDTGVEEMGLPAPRKQRRAA